MHDQFGVCRRSTHAHALLFANSYCSSSIVRITCPRHKTNNPQLIHNGTSISRATAGSHARTQGNRLVYASPSPRSRCGVGCIFAPFSARSASSPPGDSVRCCARSAGSRLGASSGGERGSMAAALRTSGRDAAPAPAPLPESAPVPRTGSTACRMRYSPAQQPSDPTSMGLRKNRSKQSPPR